MRRPELWTIRCWIRRFVLKKRAKKEDIQIQISRQWVILILLSNNNNARNCHSTLAADTTIDCIRKQPWLCVAEIKETSSSRHNHYIKMALCGWENLFYNNTGDTLFFSDFTFLEQTSRTTRVSSNTYPTFRGAFTRPTFCDETEKGCLRRWTLEELSYRAARFGSNPMQTWQSCTFFDNVQQSTDLFHGKT